MNKKLVPKGQMDGQTSYLIELQNFATKMLFEEF